MHHSNTSRMRALFLLPFSDARRSAMFGVVAMVLTLSACGSDTAQESLIEALADLEGLDVEIDGDSNNFSKKDDFLNPPPAVCKGAKKS